MMGHVSLVGAGPGDPGLITVKGRTLSPLSERFIACAHDLAKKMRRRE